MFTLPLHFHSKTSTKFGTDLKWQTVSVDGQSDVAIPPEFNGPGGALSPEDLFNHALTNCFIATFGVLVKNSKISFDTLNVQSRLTVAHDENKKPVMSEFHLKAEIVTHANEERLLLLAKKAAESGFILNSVKTKCHFDFEIKK